MVKERVERHLAADVAGYSRLMGADEEGTLAQLKAHRRALGDPKIKEHRGRIIKTTGDGMLVEFASAVDAVRCAVDIQRGMLMRNGGVPPDQRIEFRVGINVGDIIEDGDDIFGNGVNVAARLESIADRGGICISREVLDQIEDKLELNFRELCRQNLKNISKPIEVYAVEIDGRGGSAASVLSDANLKQMVASFANSKDVWQVRTPRPRLCCCMLTFGAHQS